MDDSPAPLAAPILPDPLPADPFPLFMTWCAEAAEQSITPNPNAMVLATAAQVDGEPAPSARVVLCKHIQPDPGYIVFFTNYESRKACELGEGARAAAVFHWDAMHRQVRIEGRVTRSPADESDTYFATRPLGARLGAWASNQSRPLASRADLIAQLEKARELHPDAPRPPFWGGYQLWVSSLELWAASVDRLHDRSVWTRALEPGTQGFSAGAWRSTRLQP